MKCMQAARLYRTRLLILAIIGSCFVWLAATDKPVFALAGAPQRSVQGRVVNEQDTPLRSAIVYLSDLRTLTVESYITQEDGAYRFEQISPNDDYKLWAQVEGKKSKVKTLSSFDNRSVFQVILKIDTGK